MIVLAADWQITGSSRVGRKGFGVNFGTPPTPEMIIDRPSIVLVTAVGSLASPWTKVKFSCGAERADKREVSFDGVRTTRDAIN